MKSLSRSLSAYAVALLMAGLRPVERLGAQAPIRNEAFVVVVNAGNPIEEIDRETLSNVFLKRTPKWPSGTPVNPVDLPLKTTAREAFTRAIHHKSASAIRTYWQQQIFSGREVPPPEKTSDAEVLEIVKGAPEAVGYVSATAAIPAGVKILVVRDKP
jgi:ABC-type phosphate transport system substrate-binding protein